ncbi:MAG TPA: hypothetical protein VLB27_00155 [candidate division Zixibacteria bacterium]|nr:hypothetical protein [candidate division Zixibacteria bacterium]
MKKLSVFTGIAILLFMFAGCSDSNITSPDSQLNAQSDLVTPLKSASAPEATAQSESAPLAAPGAGAVIANGWYEGEEIYYIAGGIEDGQTELGENQIYLIGGDRTYQAQVVLHIPGEPGYSPHWNVNVVHTAAGVTVADIVASPYVSAHYPEALFDDVEDIEGAQAAGLVWMEHPGVVVLCPIVPETVADAPGNTELSEDFPPFPDTF